MRINFSRHCVARKHLMSLSTEEGYSTIAYWPVVPIRALDSPPEGAIPKLSRPWRSSLVPCALYSGYPESVRVEQLKKPENVHRLSLSRYSPFACCKPHRDVNVPESQRTATQFSSEPPPSRDGCIQRGDRERTHRAAVTCCILHIQTNRIVSRTGVAELRSREIVQR